MNNCRAGLYTFALTTTWLHETGIASPPFLVMLGLALPDSRILSGIAGIGLTLANIAIILPHLRQPILDSIRAHEYALAHAPTCTQVLEDLSQHKPDVMQPDARDTESPVLVSLPSYGKEHRTPLLVHSGTVRSICSLFTEPPESLSLDLEVAPQTILPLPAEETDNNQILPETSPLSDAGSNEKRVGFDDLFSREGRSALYIPLPVPDTLEIAFFDTNDIAPSDHGSEAELAVAECEQHVVSEEHSTTEVNVTAVEKDTKLVSADFPSSPEHTEARQNLDDVVVDENPAPILAEVAVGDHHNPVAQATTTHLPDDLRLYRGIVQIPGAGSLARGNEVVAKRRPESLAFIPQSVIRRYPSAPRPSARHCLGHGTFNSGVEPRITTAPPDVFIHNPSRLLEGAKPWTTAEGHWRTSFPSEDHPKKSSMIGQTFVITAPIQRPLKQGLTPGPEPPAVHESTALTKYPIPTRRRRLGVLSRAALRDRRFAASRRRNDDVNDSSSSDSDSGFSDSQDSSGSSADESMLPHILGADLIAAIDANSESELNLVGSQRVMRTPFDAHGHPGLLVSEDSAADVSMIMHLSTKDDTSNGEARAPANFRSLTYDDIQQWASGVVQKCVRQVCRSRIQVEPLSPSQASDVCAERPSGSGISQCPLSGLHCDLGAAASTVMSVPKTKESPLSLLSPQKPLLRDTPEFVPRHRRVSVIAQESQKLGTRSGASVVARDAATEVIARMESQVGFHVRQPFGGMNKERTACTTGAWQGEVKCSQDELGSFDRVVRWG